MFNILAVLGIAGVVGPGGFNVEVLTREFPLMTGLAIVLYLMARGHNSGHSSIQRWEGLLGKCLLCLHLMFKLRDQPRRYP